MEKKSSGGIGLTGVLFLVFLVLKLTDNIDWSWWWVTSPIWIPLVFVIGVFIVLLFVFIAMLSIGYTVEDLKTKFKLKK
jgi:hypothetical protein